MFQFLFFLITNKRTINTITEHITTVSLSLCNLHSYMFRHFPVTIRQFTANTLLSYTRSSKFGLLKTQFYNIIKISK